MLQNYNKLKNTVFLVLFSVLLISLPACTKNNEEQGSDAGIFKKKRINPNVDERAREAADKGPNIIDRFSGNRDTNFQFGTSNVLWRATLSSINFMPLLAVDYAGGVIVTDWYGQNSNNNSENSEEIKLTIRFLSNELSITSVEIDSHKKICVKLKCSIEKDNKQLNAALKNKIIKMARKISIEDENKKNNKKK